MELAVTLTRANLDERLGLCSWSLHPKNVDELIAKVREIGLPSVQLGLDVLAENREGWRDAILKLRDAGITVLSGMMTCVGEDYTTIDSIHRTGGVVPDATWPQTLSNMQRAAAVAANAGLTLVTTHAGFIPNDEFDYTFAKVVKRIGQLAAYFQDYGIQLGLETGQERASTLHVFLEYVSEFDIGVNFDPANMLLYGSGDPIEALRLLVPFVKQVHVKDATRSPKPGVWGDEVPVGTGEVDWKAFFKVLRDGDFDGDLIIEREAGDNRVGDIRHAKEYLPTVIE
jgi:L-ribulose-5-phosphate 3-epimerase